MYEHGSSCIPNLNLDTLVRTQVIFRWLVHRHDLQRWFGTDSASNVSKFWKVRLRDLTAALLTGNIEKRLLHHIMFKGIVWCIFDRVNVRIISLILILLPFFFGLCRKQQVSGKKVYRLPLVLECARQILHHFRLTLLQNNLRGSHFIVLPGICRYPRAQDL